MSNGVKTQKFRRSALKKYLNELTGQDIINIYKDTEQDAKSNLSNTAILAEHRPSIDSMVIGPIIVFHLEEAELLRKLTYGNTGEDKKKQTRRRG